MLSAEKNSVSPSGSDHTGSSKGQNMPPPTGTEEVRRRPPRTLQLNPAEQTAGGKPIFSSSAPRVRPRSSPLIEKLQANLALSPTTLLPTSRSSEVNLPPSPFSPGHAHSPFGLPSPALSSPGPTPGSEEEAPISFERPPEGTALPSINKDRARLSFKRRPPTRQLRKSCSEEPAGEEGAAGGQSSPCQLDGQQKNEGAEEEAERTNRKVKGVRARKSSGRDGGGADEDGEETVAVTQEVKSAPDEAPAAPEGEGLPGEPCSEDRVRANQEEGAETQPQEEEEGENVIGPDEVTIEVSVK
ncbi:capZ-interacting protein isoform X1 [Anguilla rostrata]|uniref:capZ-interacting protein isoform X1 n=2 Tax=Anguilla rostrata TaxID=7938 RepID=UPI0030D32824